MLPRARSGCGRWIRAGFIFTSATSIAAKLSAFRPKQGATPQRAMITPAIAGPTIRAEWTSTELRLTALTTRSGPTISITNACRAGLSTARTSPRRAITANTIQASTAPRAVRANRTVAGTAIPVWEIISSLRLSKRSASAPPIAPNRRIPENCRAVARPTATPEPVSSRTSQSSATICIQLPASETTWPPK